MKKGMAVLSVLFACLLMTAPASALDNEFLVGGSYTDADNAKSGSLDFELDLEIGNHFAFGPALRGEYFDPDDGPGVGVYGAGFAAVFSFTDEGDGPYVAVTALYHFGDAESGTMTVSPEAGLKFGGDHAFIRIGIAQPYEFNEDSDALVDLERTEGRVRVGFRF